MDFTLIEVEIQLDDSKGLKEEIIQKEWDDFQTRYFNTISQYKQNI